MKKIFLKKINYFFELFIRWTVRLIEYSHQVGNCSYPITTFQGGGGGIKIAEGYRLGMKYMTSKQKALLERLSESLSGEELVTMHSILKTFSNPVKTPVPSKRG